MVTLSTKQLARLATLVRKGLSARIATALADTVTQDDLDAVNPAPDASATVKGKVQLTGDLGGTATSPTVPGLTGKMAKPVGVTDYSLPIADTAQTEGFRWGTSQETVARALGWLVITDPQWGGAAAGNDWIGAIRAAVNYIDRWDNVNKTWLGGSRGGTVWFPASGSAYGISACIVISARIRLKGANGGRYGGVASVIQAIPSGTFTNTDSPAGAGLEPGMPWMLRTSRNAKESPEWFHGGQVTGLELDANGVFTGGLVTSAGGELSLFDDLHISNTGTQTRTLTATFNGTSTVTLAAGNLDELEDFRARVTSPVFPAYTDWTRTDATTTAGSAVVTVGGGVTSALVGAEVTGGNVGFLPTAYVVSVNPGVNQFTLSEVPAVDAAIGSGKSITLGQPRDFRIDQIDSATSIQLSRPVPYTGTGQLTIYRGRPGMRCWGLSATGHIGSLNVTTNSGAGLEMIWNPGNRIDVVSGDNNGGPLVRFHICSTNGDPQSVSIGALKIENNNYGDTSAKQYENYGRHDPAVALTKCGMVNINILSAQAYAGDRGTRYLVRIQQSTSASWSIGYPSLNLDGIEASNPWNVNFNWLVYDRDAGIGVPGGNMYFPTYGGRFYPSVRWNKDSIVFGDTYLRKVPASGLGGNLYVDGESTARNQPAHAKKASRTAPWDAALGVYNLKTSNSRKLRRDLARAATAGAICEWLVYGDSKSAGHLAGGGGAAWPFRLQKGLERQGYPSAGGIASAAPPSNTVADPRWGFSGTVGHLNSVSATLNTNGATATFTSTHRGTSVDIWYFNTSGTFTYSIDGGAAVPVTPTGANNTAKITVAGLANSQHRVVVTRTSAATTVYLIGVDVYSASGVKVHNFADYGMVSDYANDISTFAANGTTIRAITAPTVTFIALGTNDMFNSAGGDLLFARLGTLIDNERGRASAPDVILLAETSAASPDSAWESYVTRLYDLAESKDVPLIDLHALAGGNSTLTGLGILGGDGMHETALGHEWIAEQLVRALSRPGPSNTLSDLIADTTMPQRISIMGDTPPNSISNGFWNIGYNASALHTTAAVNSSGALNDDIRWNVALAKGTWRIDFSQLKSQDNGIQTWDISYDGGSTFVGTNGTSGVLATHESFSGRTVNDAVTNGTTTITSATAAFVAGDVGKKIVGTNIPAGATIVSQTGTAAVMSAAATGSSSGGQLSIGGNTSIEVWNIQNITVPQTGKAILRCRMLTKNIGTAGYFMQLSAMHLTRTA